MQPEQGEDPEEPAADADLAELFEQFREPEETPRKRANPLWFVSAILLSVLGVWLALQASGGSVEEKPESAALAGAMLPGKTSERLPREDEPVDVVEDYLARCKRGMTAQEVRWIVEDFQRAGLDWGEGGLSQRIAGILKQSREGPFPDLYPQSDAQLEELVLKLGQRQRAWYASALKDGLRLDHQQIFSTIERLDSLLDEDLDSNQKAISEIKREAEEIGGVERLDGRALMIIGELVAKDVVVPDQWLLRDDYAPWKLCDLKAEQEAVTRRSEMGEEGVQQDEAKASYEIYGTTSWHYQGTPFRSSLANKRAIRLADGEFGQLAAAGHIFPLEEAQLFEGEKFLRIDDPTRLHPAQLKLLLLLEPERAAEILQALEKADK